MSDQQRPAWERLRWPGDRRLAVSLNVLLEGYSTGESPVLGPMGNPLVAGTVDSQALSWIAYAPKLGIYRIMRMLDRHGLRATVFVSSVVAQNHPEVVLSAEHNGHEVAAHGYAQDVIPAYQTKPVEAESIRQCTSVLRSLLGRQPRGWLSPRATPSVDTCELLLDNGYEYQCDYFDDHLPYVRNVDGRRIVAIPLTMDVNDLPSLVRYGNPPLAILQTFSDVLEQFTNSGETVLLDITMHVHVAGRPYVASVYDRVMSVLAQRPDAWIATRGEIADYTLSLS